MRAPPVFFMLNCYDSFMKLYHRVLVLIVALEAASFISFLSPQASVWAFGVVAICAIVLTVRKLEYGVMLLFGELVIGSFGRELELSIGGFDISIRMVLWLVVLLVWAIQKKGVRNLFEFKKIPDTFFQSKLFKPYLVLVLVLGWGIVWGMIRGNGLGAVFSDTNNYLYFALIFPVYDVLRSQDALRRLGIVIALATGYLATKSIILFYIFSHELFRLQDSLYTWSRASHLAEITNVDPAAILSRVFMQSQIWLVFGFFVLLGVLYMSLRVERTREAKQSYHRNEDNHSKGLPKQVDKIATSFMGYHSLLAMTIGLLILSLTAIIASFSRSFWLAMVITFVVLVIVLFAVMRERLKTVGRFIALTAGTGVLAVGLVLVAMQFPIPAGNADADVIKNRAGKFTGEAAVSSRYAQIKPLLESIKIHPVLGSGFGTSVTYESQDPRVLKNNPDGQYTTTAFELGWLEMWLKIGLLGVGAYLYLFWRIFKLGLRQITCHPDRAYSRVEGSSRYLILGALAGLAAVALTHGVSPYLNHPLGIGIVMLVTVLVDYGKSPNSNSHI